MSTFEITPMASILASSCATLGRRGSAILRGVDSANGFASGLSVISNSSPRFPNPWNTFGKCWTRSALVCTASMRVASCKAVIAGKPNKLFFSPYVGWLDSRPLWVSLPVKYPNTFKGTLQGPYSILSGVRSVGFPRIWCVW